MIEPILRYGIFCNRCARGEYIDYNYRTHEFKYEPLIAKGWTEFGGNVHYCPECEKKFLEGQGQ